MSTIKKLNKFQEIQDSLTRVRKRVMAIGAYKGCMHTALAAVNDLNKAEELLEELREEIINEKEANMNEEINDNDKPMEAVTYKLPTFEFEKQSNDESNLSYEAKSLLILLNAYKNDEAYNLIDGFIPFDFDEIKRVLNYSAEDIESRFRELEGRKLISRCTARFVCVHEQERGAK
jgi:DNA-binding Lrp family transcriptional regulator